jgi:hypothetical protein
MLPKCLGVNALMLALAIPSWSIPIKVFILSGQSNMVGLGKVGTPEANIATYSKIRIYHSLDGATTVSYWPKLEPGHTGLPPNTTTPAGSVADPYSKFGPEFGIAEKLSARYPNDNLAFIKVAYGGTSLGVGPSSALKWLATDQVLYNWFTDKVSQSLALLAKDPQGYQIWGVFWMQGEQDASEESLAKKGVYGANLKTLVDNKIRTFLNSYPKNGTGLIPFVYGQIRPTWPFAQNILKEQHDAQSIIAKARCTQMPMNASNYSATANPGMEWAGYNAAHYNASGLKQVGNGLGQAILDLFDAKAYPGCPESVSPAEHLLDIID